MPRYNYYGVKDGEAWHMATDYRPSYVHWFQPALFRESDLVWCQGTQGGVRLIHENWNLIGSKNFRKLGYITTNEKAMQEFTWVKLKARTLTFGK